MVVTTIHMDAYQVPAPGPAGAIVLDIQPGMTCPNAGAVGSCSQYLSPGGVGETDVPFNPGLAIPAGDTLCAVPQNIDAEITVTGYLVSSGEAPAGTLHRVPALPRQHG
jgi:hypothetical protein